MGVEKKAIASDSDKYFDHVKNAWDAETEIVPVAKKMLRQFYIRA